MLIEGGYSSKRKETVVLNCDNSQDKRTLLSRIGALHGLWRVELTPYRPRRSDRQNRWYWPAIVTPLADYLSSQDYNVTRPEQAHEILKHKFLTVDVVNTGTGETIGERVRSTTELSTEEFSDYCERCRAWLADAFGIVVPDP